MKIMGRKLNNEEYKQKLKETNPEYESLASYQGSKIKIPHRHIKCGYIWDVKPNVLYWIKTHMDVLFVQEK